MKALVTGATGFIGGALASALLSAGWEVNLLVRPASRGKLPGPANGTAGALPYRVFEADLSRDSAGIRAGFRAGFRDGFRQAVEGCQVVFHAAAIRNRWGASLEEYRQTNVEGTRRLLQASLGCAQRFVYVSSVGVFGYPGVLGIDETFPLNTRQGKTGYHASKAEAERLALEARSQIETVIVRPTITYGPGDGDGMLTRLIAMIARGRFLRVGRGGNHLHLTYIDDLVSGLVQAGVHPAAPGEVFILAGPQTTAVRELIAEIHTCLGRQASAFFIPEELARLISWGVEKLYRAGKAAGLLGSQAVPPITPDKIDTLCVHRGFTSAKAERLLGYTPRVSLTQGLEATVRWMASTGIMPARAGLAGTGRDGPRGPAPGLDG